MKRAPHEQGMALLTVLLMVAVMSVLAVAALDDIRFGLRRTANAAEVGQAQWYAIGAEELARTQIRRLSAQNAGRITAAGGWNGREFLFPIEGGLIRARVEDGGNCFDLNSVAQGPPGSWTAFEPGQRQFAVLLQALAIPAGEAAVLSRGLVDWIDSDPSGDAAYAGRGYRTGGGLLTEVSELRAVQGVTPELYARLRPYVCALPRTPRPGEPSSQLSPININTLREDQALLVTMLTGGALPLAEARAWLARRPAEGWSDPNVLIQHPLLVDQPPSPSPYLQIANGMSGYPSRFFALQATVGYGRAEVAMSSLFEHDKATGGIRLAARRWTTDE